MKKERAITHPLSAPFRSKRAVFARLRKGLSLLLSFCFLAACLPAEDKGTGIPSDLGRPESATVLPTTAAQIEYPPFLIGPGDLLNVTVFGEKDLPSTFLVDSSGTIVFPPVGALDVGGLTQVEASRVLTAALAKYIKDPQVTVLVTDSAQYTVSVMGNVGKPGKYLIRGMPTLLGAVAEAGGPMINTALNNTVLVRNNRTYNVPLGKYLETGHGSQPQPVLFPGDIIYVPVSHWPTLGDWGIIISILTSVVILEQTVKTLR